MKLYSKFELRIIIRMRFLKPLGAILWNFYNRYYFCNGSSGLQTS